MTQPAGDFPVDEVELHCLLEAMRLRYGYDFRGYAHASLRRRVATAMSKGGLSNVAELQHRVLHDEAAFRELITDISVGTTEMFRDPDFFAAVRDVVVPRLRTWPFLRIWHAGCSTGEEVYSLAIVLHEEGLLERSRIYATDLSEPALEVAREGILDPERVPDYTRAYQHAGGRAPFSRYYSATHGRAVLDPSLRANVVFSPHNLVHDQVFSEMNLVLCRNVLIYFQRKLQDRALTLFRDSLCRSGILCLGTKEMLRFTGVERSFKALDEDLRIYRKVGE